MSGKELLELLNKLDHIQLNYTVLVHIEDRWVKLDTMTLDPGLKTLDLEGEK